MAKPLRYRETQIQGVRESVVNVDQPNIGGVGQVSLTGPQQMPDLPDLAGLSNSLAKAYITIKAKDNEEQQDLGFSQAAQDANRHDWNTLVREDLIPEGANPYFITGYRKLIARRYGAEEVDDIISNYSKEETDYTVGANTGVSKNLRINTPNIDNVISEATNSKHNHTNLLNPTLMADPYFQKELADYRARVIPQVRDELHKKNNQIKEDATRHNFALEGRTILEAISTGHAQPEEFTKWSDILYYVGIKDPHGFVFDVVKGYTYSLMNKKDEHGDIVDPEPVLDMLGKFGDLKVNNVPIAQGTKADDFESLRARVESKVSGGGGTRSRYEKFRDRELMNENSPLFQVMSAPDSDSAIELSRLYALKVLTDNRIPAHHKKAYIDELETAGKKWQEVDKIKLAKDNAAIDLAADRGDLVTVEDGINNLPLQHQPAARERVRKASDALQSLVLTNQDYKAGELEWKDITNTSEQDGNQSFTNFRNNEEAKLRASILADYKNAKTEADKHRVLNSIPERVRTTTKTIKEEAEKRHTEVKALRIKLTERSATHRSSLDDINKLALEGKLTPAQEKELRTIDNNNVDLRTTLESGDFVNRIDSDVAKFIGARAEDIEFKKKFGLEGLQTSTISDRGTVFLDPKGLKLQQQITRKVLNRINTLLDEGKIKDKSDLFRASYLAIQEEFDIVPEQATGKPEVGQVATKPTEVAAVKPVVPPVAKPTVVKPDPYKAKEDMRLGLDELVTVSGLSKLEDEHSKNKESAKRLDDFVSGANKKIIEDMKAGIVYPDRDIVLLRLNRSKGLDAHMLADKKQSILFGTDTPISFEKLPSNTYEETPLFKTKDSMKDFFSGISTPETRGRVDRLFSMMDLKYSNEEEFMSLVRRFIHYQNHVMKKFQGENK